jgi:hypothetical protein
MPTLSNIEKQRLERALVMGGGYVLSFSNSSFYEFFRDTVGIEIGHQRYERGSGSKANRMRAFWDTAETSQILRVLETLIEGWDIYSLDCAGADRAPLEAVVSRIRRAPFHGTVSSPAAPTRVEDMKFTVALSFPGLHRRYVQQIATHLGSSLGSDRVFYDQHYQAQLARPGLDTLLQRIYHDQSALIVVFLSSGYATSEWCGLEWRAVRDIIKRKRADQIMFVRFDDTDIEGAFSIDGYIDARKYDPAAVSRFIIQRVTATPIPQPSQVVGTANELSASVCSDSVYSMEKLGQPSVVLNDSDTERVVWCLPRGIIVLEDVLFKPHPSWAVTAHYYHFGEGSRGGTHYHKSYSHRWTESNGLGVQCRKLRVPRADYNYSFGAFYLMQTFRDVEEKIDICGKVDSFAKAGDPLIYYKRSQPILVSEVENKFPDLKDTGELRDLIAEMEQLSDTETARGVASAAVEDGYSIGHRVTIESMRFFGSAHPSMQFIQTIVNDYDRKWSAPEIMAWLKKLKRVVREALIHK